MRHRDECETQWAGGGAGPSAGWDKQRAESEVIPRRPGWRLMGMMVG